MVSSIAMALKSSISHSVQHLDKYLNYVPAELDVYNIDPFTIGYNPHTRDTEHISVWSSYIFENCYIWHGKNAVPRTEQITLPVYPIIFEL